MSRGGGHGASRGSDAERRNRRARKASKEARRERRAPRTELDRLLDDPNGLANANPLMAEVAASAILASWGEYTGEGESTADVCAAVFTRFAERGGRNELAMLHAMRPMLPRRPLEVAREAEAAIEALHARGHADPRWAEIVAQPAFVEAWARTDEFGDVTVAAATFQHPGWPPHLLGFACDHTFGGLIREAMFDVDGSRGPDTFIEAAERPPEPLSGQDLATLIWRGTLGLKFPGLWPDVSVDEGAASGAPLLLARARVLPPPHYERSPSIPVPERKRLVREFIDASWPNEPAGVRVRSPRLRPAREVGEVLVAFNADRSPSDLLRCTPGTLTECLYHELPIALGADLDQDAVLAAMRAWVRFTGVRTGRALARTVRLLEVVDDLEPAFRGIVDEMGGPARALVRAMLAEGVDVIDQAAVDEWLARFNRRPARDRERILGPLPERAGLGDAGRRP